MKIEQMDIDEHVGAFLSGYIDGELTQQQRQRVDVHCERCEDCRKLRDDLIALRSDVGEAMLSQYGDDKWRETMDDTGVQVTRGIGWLLFLAGALGLAGIVVFGFLLDSSVDWFAKLVIVGFYGGLAVLLVSVIRQRLIERKTDKYKDVEI